MKTKIATLLLAAAFTCLGAFSARAEGDICDIWPCDENGVDLPAGSDGLPVGWSSFDAPITDSGTNAYFKVRLVAKAEDVSGGTVNGRWRLVIPDDSIIASDYWEKVGYYPIQIGIYASGAKTYASLVSAKKEGTYTMSLVFRYRVKAGDFAMPVRLATDTGPAWQNSSSGEYVIDDLGTGAKIVWQTLSAGEVTHETDCTWSFIPDDGGIRFTYAGLDIDHIPSFDYTLSNCGIYVRTVDFDDNRASDDFWRTVYMSSSTIKEGGAKLTLKTTAPVEELTTVYVWSDDEDAVRIEGGENMDLGADPLGKSNFRQVATVTFQGGSAVSSDFKIYGVMSNETCNLVLSPYPYYATDTSSGDPRVITNFLTTAVRCEEKLSPTVQTKIDVLVGSGKTVYASSDYLKPVATLTVSVTEAPESDFEASLVPSFSGDAAYSNWWDYVYIAEATDLDDEGNLSEFSESTKTTVPPTVTFTPTTTSHTFYLFALRADERTNRAGHQMKFTPDWESHPYAKLEKQSAACYIQAYPPEASIEKGGSSETPASVICNDPLYLKISVTDTFADLTSTNGYTLTVSLDASGALPDPDPITNLVMGAGGYLYVAKEDGTPSTTLPSVAYGLSSAGSDPDYYTSSFTVTSPESGLTSDPVPFYVKVVEKTKYTIAITDEGTGETFATGTPAFEEGDEVTFTITLNAPNMLNQTIYAYLAFKTDFDASKVFESDDEEFIVGMNNLEGLAINPRESIAEGTVRFLDNAPAKRLQISKVYFSYNSSLDATNMTDLISYDYDTANSVTRFTLANVEPVLNKIKIGTVALDPGTVYTTKLPLNAERRFTADVTDVAADLVGDPDDVTNRFETVWSTWCYQIGDGESVDDYADAQIPGLQFENMDPNGEAKSVYGNPKDHSFTNVFEIAGIWKITCQLKDKDMDSPSAEYSLYLKVTDAGVNVSQLSNFDENDRSQQLSVSLNYYDSQFAGTVFVALKVKSNAPDSSNLGRLKFNESLLWTNVWPTVPPFELSDSGSVTNEADAAADYYLLSFSSRNQLTQKLSILDADGVNDTFTYKAYVVSAQKAGVETLLPASGKLAASYYAPSEVCQVTVFNADPVRQYIRVSPNPDSNTNIWTSAKTINWTVPYNSDVSGDFAAGIEVKIIGDGVVNPLVTNIYGTTTGSFTPNFGGASGSGEVVMTVTDKDGGYQEWVWRYELPAAKTLVTIPNGPKGTGNSELSQKYVAAEGRGKGHLYAQGATVSTAVDHYITWFCQGMLEVPVYGFGYKVGAYDNGFLDGGRDQAIDASGDLASKATSAAVTAGYYSYPGNFDSYLYAWIISAPASDAAATEWTLTIAAEKPAESPIPATAALPTQETGDKKGYVPVKAEAVFAREWKTEDNCGDINQDGIPDFLAHWGWGGGKLIALMGGDPNEDDLMDLATSNPDNDYLPGIYGQDSSARVQGSYDVTIGNDRYQPLAKNSYAPVGIAFSTFHEMRGFGGGLNEQTYAKSAPSFTETERRAWLKYVADYNAAKADDDPELDPETLDLAIWSPMPSGSKYRMDPTLEDTDGDGFPDGWEYYFWYMAHVWVPAHQQEAKDGDIGVPRDGQHFVFERFNVNKLVVGDEIPLDEVKARFNPCERYYPERFNGAKYLRDDFDGDGLADLEELLIGTNPCHWDTDGDRMCDGWEVMMCLDPLNGSKRDNPDGDCMAFRSVRNDFCWIDPDTATTNPETEEIEPYAEGTRIYGLTGLQQSVDYDQQFVDGKLKYVMLRTMDVVSYSFTPKYLDGELLVYGLREDIPIVIPEDWVWGWYMVDDVRCETITLNAGDEIVTGLQYVLIHDQVHDGFGFDPRTGWGKNSNGYVSDRWDPNHNRNNISLTDATGYAENTRAYENYDEYLVMKYRMQYGIDYAPLTSGNTPNAQNDDPYNLQKESLWALIKRKTTNPNVVYPVIEDAESGSVSTNDTVSASIAASLARAFAQLNSDKAAVTTHGADTDEDGVPDGWELYMYRNPNASPNVAEEDGRGLTGSRDFDGDTLSWVMEYAGVDACNVYKDCESIYKNHPGNKSGWWNKFFPTNPGTMKLNDERGTTVFAGNGNEDGLDTDFDGVSDSVEGGTWAAVFANGGNQYGAELGFIYGSPTDDGLTVCFRGGGMNPCTIDTDVDGIPDGWEMQHAGVPVQLPGKNVIPPRGAEPDAVAGIVINNATFIADGLYANSNVVEGVYIAGGMDATWKGDAVFDSVSGNDSRSWDDILRTRRDTDFDHDGLQNYQEYLTQTIRHFRYDDITTPLMGRQLQEGDYDPDTSIVTSPHAQTFGDKDGESDDTGNGYPVFDPADPENFAANAAEAWNGKSFVYYETVTTGVKEVVKVIDPYTGASSTNRIYYTARRKKFKPGATLVADHVANGGTSLQQAWDVDGWRTIGYFAPPRRDWDRATASGKFLYPLYLYPITDGKMVGVGFSVAGYATTDPRMADTDGDGMDDFYEMYHGLNPLLGTSPASASDTEWINMKYGDIVSAQFYMANYPMAESRPTFNAWYNEWIYPTYSGILGRQGDNPGDEVGAPIQEPQAYDPVLYPWSMGINMVDADGDGIRNDEERIIANVADPVGRHTDPSPLWFTERTTPASYTAQYYVKPEQIKYMPWSSGTADIYEDAATRTRTDATHDLYFPPPLDIRYEFSFEENEGYDTDGDMSSDAMEVVSTVRTATDPLRFDDPRRRQAFYLPGENAYAISRDLQYRPVDAVDFLKQFTVECWVMPEKIGEAQTIVDRPVAYEGDSINTDKTAIRSNFRIGLDAQGKVYGMFDNNDSIESGLNAPRSCQFVEGGPLPLNEWSHVALVFDGERLHIYVNALLKDSAPTALVPANGVTQIIQDTTNPGMFPATQYSCKPSAFLIGARPKKQNAYALYPYYIEDGEHMESFDNLQEYFQGYVDEVRVWDGARTGTQIGESYMKSIGFEEAAVNRDNVFSSWYGSDGTRNSNDGNPTLPPELVLNYDFSTLPGAANAEDVAKVPAGFTKNVLNAAMSDYETNEDIDTSGLYPNLMELKGLPDGEVEGDLLVGWWNESLVHSTVYDDYHVVPWIKNTVSHLPLLDGGAVDSFMYNDDFGSVYMTATELGVSKMVFPNTAMPYPSTVFNEDRYYRLAHARVLSEQRSGDFDPSSFLAKCQFQVRNNFVGTADLVPMGGAFAKTCAKMWDGSVADPWEQTGVDTSGDGIPDWWEEYARHNYATDLDPADSLNWDTLIDYRGASIPAGKAYVIDIYRGMQPDGTIDPAYAVNTDSDGDNIPDWWENLFGVAEYGADDDTDGDGLSNYAEYLFSFGAEPYGTEMGFPFLDPSKQRSLLGQKVTDYYLAGPGEDRVSADGSVTNIFARQYLGEISTDHDFMEDWWERLFAVGYANPRQYDPGLDRDGDSWSNWAEARTYTWRGAYSSDTVDSYYDANDVTGALGKHIDNYPRPAIGLRFYYDGDQDVTGRGIVVRVTSGRSPRTDASFVLMDNATRMQTNPRERTIIGGFFGEGVIRGFLNPGSLVPGDVNFQMARLGADRTYYWIVTIARNSIEQHGSWDDYRAAIVKYGGANVKLEDTAMAFEAFAMTTSDAFGVHGDIMLNSADTASTLDAKVGSINFHTGEYEIDLAKAVASGANLEAIVFRADYAYMLPEKWPKTLWFSETSSGWVREGLNTVEAWIDIDGDGEYTPGEPYGTARGINVGWHKTAETMIELKDTSSVIPHYMITDGRSDRSVVNGPAGGVNAIAVGEGEGNEDTEGLTAKIVVRRVGINGQRTFGQKTVPVRTLVSRSYIFDDRAYLAEADVLSDDKFDLDWKWLVSDATKLGLTASDISSVEYEIGRATTLSDGTVTNEAVATFSNEFGRQRPVPVPRAPLAEAPVYSASPTFSWSCSDDTMTAFRIQVSTSTNASDVVYDTGIRHLPGRDSIAVGVVGYSFTAPIYADAPVSTNGAAIFLDGSNYFWRVTEFNAKYSFEEANGWSVWSQFQMDVANKNVNPTLPTGFGKCGAVVRYFGPGAVPENQVIVEVHSSADFAGKPLAQKRANASQIADRDDLTTVNTEFAGVEPGTAYLMAYIDRNNNGVRDSNESWGYANYVGTEASAIFTPQGVKITDETNRGPSVVIYIEDTDVNRNEIPDCIEGDGVTAGDSGADDGDRDGLKDDEEDGFATDASVWDTDGDGMPDGWEVKFADLDPNFDDASETSDGDVMAYAELPCTVVTVQNTEGSDPVNYILKDGQRAPFVGDTADGLELYVAYDYPVVKSDGVKNYYGRGAEIDLVAPEGTTNRVIAVTPGTVALVHAQVYDEFGFNSLTANPIAFAAGTAVNTKAFTALDKYLVIRYFESLGICNEDAVNVGREWAQYSLRPLDVDSDFDGVADGWELYVMFGDAEDKLAALESGDVVSPWDFYDRFRSFSEDDLALVGEYDGGNMPTDPWQVDTDGDGISDKFAQKFHLKGTDGNKDFDGDGLSNYAEYMLAVVLEVGDFDPDDATSVNENISDYFFKLGQLYVGEVFTDHDRVSDQWERIYLPKGKSVSPGVYDSGIDADGDGWSNEAEFQTGTDPTKSGSLSVDAIPMDEYPVPTVELTLSYLQRQSIADAPVIVKAWRDQTLTGKPDAVWMLGGQGDVSVTENGNSNVVTGVKYFGMNPMREMLIHLSPGSVAPGSVKFEFKDLAWVLYNEVSGQSYFNDPATATWEGGIIDSDRNDGTGIGDIISQDEPSKSLGTIDYSTGEVRLDFSAFPETLWLVGDISGSVTGNGWYSIFNLQKSYVRVNWQSKLVSGGNVNTYYLSEAERPSATNNSNGHLKEGLNTFVAFYDLDGDGKFTPGEPYGFARDVDVGWNYAKASIELTDTSVVTPRYKLTVGGESEGSSGDTGGSAEATDREELWEMSANDVLVVTNGAAVAAPAKGNVRVRIVRFAIDSLMTCLPAADMAVVYDGYLDLTDTGNPVLTEAELMADVRNRFDIDWDATADGSSQTTLKSVYNKYKSQVAFTNMLYTVYFGNEPIIAKVDTNANMLCRILVRKFDTVRHAPEKVQGADLVTTAAPVFSWKDNSVDNTYTAFRVRLRSGGSTGTVIWTSDYQLMPPRDHDNVYNWASPLRVGAMVPGGNYKLESGKIYTWEISTYNAKYKDDSWTVGGTFKMDELTSTLDYGTAKVAVKYFGPYGVLAQGNPVRVQAFKTPDFSGEPAGEGYVFNMASLYSTDAPTEANAYIQGLMAGTYYIRAFIDTYNDGKITSKPYSDYRWESWGCYCTRDVTTGTIYTPKSVTVGPGVGGGETIVVYIDDCDTDRDTVPDVWEMAQRGDLTSMNCTSIDQVVGGFAMNKALSGALRVRGDTSSGLDVASSQGLAATNLRSARVAALILDLDEAGGTDEELLDSLAAARSDETAEPTSVAITAIDFDRSNGTVTITADTEGTKVSSSPTSQLYTFSGGESSLTLTLKLWFRASLDAQDWSEVGSTKVTIEKASRKYTYNFAEGVDLSSGFFKVTLEK